MSVSTWQMTTSPEQSAARVGTAMAVGSMSMVQIGIALSVGLFDQIGAEGAAWLRLVWAGIIFAIVVRPWRLRFTRSALLTCIALGVATGAVTMLFMAAVARIPLGTASALEFLGPLGVAVARGRGASRWWALVAAVGVVALTEPWHGGTDPLGIAFALSAAVCWASYIVLTQRAGDEVSGLNALAISMPVAGIVATIAVGPAVIPDLTWQVVVIGIGLAIMLPIIPFSLELLALRRLTTSAFGTLMSLEPAIAVIVGVVLLGQVPGWSAVIGVALVVAAGVGAERTGARVADPYDESDFQPAARHADPRSESSAGSRDRVWLAVTTGCCEQWRRTGGFSRRLIQREHRLQAVRQHFPAGVPSCAR